MIFIIKLLPVFIIVTLSNLKASEHALSPDYNPLRLKHVANKINNVFIGNNEPIPVATPSNA
jgi:hypothetical protein